MDQKKITSAFKKYARSRPGISSTALDSYVQHIENMTRTVIEERPTNFREIDVFSRLIMDRIIFLGTEIDDLVANVITAQLLFLESTDETQDILLYINSPGGSVYAGLGIYDTMQYIRPDVATICTSLAASMGATLLAGGADKKRAALPHARVMIHQPMSGMQGKASDMEISLRQTMAVKKDLYKIFAKHTRRSYEDIEKDSSSDFWLCAAEAKTYGLIDEVLQRSNTSKKK